MFTQLLSVIVVLISVIFWQAITQMEENLNVSTVSTLEKSVTAFLTSKYDSKFQSLYNSKTKKGGA